MMDEFAEKRSMVKMLMDMLKKSSSDEVANGMKAPEGTPEDAKGLEIEKVSVLPHDERGDASPEMASKMADGGMVDENTENAYANADPDHQPGMTGQEMADAQMAGLRGMPSASQQDDEDGGDQQASAFSSFMGKKKGKK